MAIERRERLTGIINVIGAKAHVKHFDFIFVTGMSKHTAGFTYARDQPRRLRDEQRVEPKPRGEEGGEELVFIRAQTA